MLLQHFQDRLGLGLPRRLSRLGGAAADPHFNGIDVADPRNDVTRDAGPGGFEHRHELPACMRQTEGEPDRCPCPVMDKLLVRRVAVNLEDAGERHQLGFDRRRVAAFGEDVGH